MKKTNKALKRDSAADLVVRLSDYVRKFGRQLELPEGVVFWDTAPVLAKDVCFLGVALLPEEAVPVFCDIYDGVVKLRRNADELDAASLEAALDDMKAADSK